MVRSLKTSWLSILLLYCALELGKWTLSLIKIAKITRIGLRSLKDKTLRIAKAHYRFYDAKKQMTRQELFSLQVDILIEK